MESRLTGQTLDFGGESHDLEVIRVAVDELLEFGRFPVIITQRQFVIRDGAYDERDFSFLILVYSPDIA